tara:strand:+ start:521 stop:892 length:372 start_codon:yes stop_codon:yes gene_type:complete
MSEGHILSSVGTVDAMKAKEALRKKYEETLPSIQEVGEVVRWVGDGIGETGGEFRWMFTDIARWQRKVTPGESYIMVESVLEETRFPTWGEARDYLTAEDNFHAKRYYKAAVDFVEEDDDEDE